MDVVGSLAQLREEWQEAVDGENLIDVQASVGLLLGDVVMLLGLSADEQVAVLGEELRREFIQELRHRDRGNGYKSSQAGPGPAFFFIPVQQRLTKPTIARNGNSGVIENRSL